MAASTALKCPPHLGLCCFISPCPDFRNPKITLCPHPVAPWKCAVVSYLILWELALDGIIYLFFLCLSWRERVYIRAQESKVQLYIVWIPPASTEFSEYLDSREFLCLLRRGVSIGGSQMEMNKLNLKSSFTSFWLVIWKSTFTATVERWL